MIVYATFVMFYLPCLATLSTLKRELGTRAMLTIAALIVDRACLCIAIAWCRVDHVALSTSMAAAAISAEPRISASSLKSNLG